MSLSISISSISFEVLVNRWQNRVKTSSAILFVFLFQFYFRSALRYFSVEKILKILPTVKDSSNCQKRFFQPSKILPTVREKKIRRAYRAFNVVVKLWSWIINVWCFPRTVINSSIIHNELTTFLKAKENVALISWVFLILLEPIFQLFFGFQGVTETLKWS